MTKNDIISRVNTLSTMTEAMKMMVDIIREDNDLWIDPELQCVSGSISRLQTDLKLLQNKLEL